MSVKKSDQGYFEKRPLSINPFQAPLWGLQNEFFIKKQFYLTIARTVKIIGLILQRIKEKRVTKRLFKGLRVVQLNIAAPPLNANRKFFLIR